MPVMLCWFCTAYGQTKPTTAAERWEGLDRKKKLEQVSVVNHIKFRSIGPSVMGGRVVDVEVNPEKPTEFYLAYATGGVWYTTNNGQSFTPITDSLDVISIGDIAVNWKDKIVWVGTGEANAQRNVLAGTGVYKTFDNGRSWEYIGLPESQHIGKVLLHPLDTNIAWVGVMGSISTPNKDRGLFKTVDGGKTWVNTLYINDTTGVIDIDISQKNPDALLAASWTCIKRQPWNTKLCGSGTGIYKSSDGGKTWIRVTVKGSGFPTGDSVGRIGLSVFAKDDKVVYAVLDNRANNRQFNVPYPIGAEIYKSEDGGTSWRKKKSENFYSSYGWYFGKIQVASTNQHKILSGGLWPVYSEDGETFKAIYNGTIHADHHAAWINPRNDDHIVIGNDGGCNISYDFGKNSFKVQQPSVGQYYAIAVDNAIIKDREGSYYVYGGLQDNHAWVTPSYMTGNMPFVPTGDDCPVKQINGPGDGMQIQIDSRDNKTIYSGLEYGWYKRFTLGSKENLSINMRGKDSTARTNWETPIHLSRHNQDVFYYGANRLYRSLNRGDSMKVISADLTRGKKGDSKNFGTLTTIYESLLKFGLLYTGSDDGLIYRSKDGGNTWALLNGEKKRKMLSLPNNLWVTRIIASRFKKGRVYAAMSGYIYDDFKPYLFVSEDYGETWLPINKDLPCEPVYVIREDPNYENLLYIGTEGGLYVSMNRGLSWMAWNNGLPRSVPVRDIAIQERENEIVLGTYGRSLYVGKLNEVQKIAKSIN